MGFHSLHIFVGLLANFAFGTGRWSMTVNKVSFGRRVIAENLFAYQAANFAFVYENQAIGFRRRVKCSLQVLKLDQTCKKVRSFLKLFKLI